jgi:acyl-CoA synthetase (AMP-forming)/AMP-acid ligase II
MYLTQGLHRSVQRKPAQIALTHLGPDGARSHRFDEFVDQVARQAAALQAQGVRSGDRVALLSVNDDRMIHALFACWWLGAAACPLNVRASTPELAHALADCEPALLLTDEALAQRLPDPGRQGRRLPTLGLNAFADAAATLAPLPDSRTGGDALAAILSGRLPSPAPPNCPTRPTAFRCWWRRSSTSPAWAAWSARPRPADRA